MVTISSLNECLWSICTPQSESSAYFWPYSVSSNLGVNIFPVSRSSQWPSLSNLDSGESLLGAVFDRTSAALG